MSDVSGPVTIRLLADEPALVAAVGEMRWREWGRPPEPVELAWWVAVTGREAGRDHLPVTWVAISPNGEAVGAVGLGQFDIEERHDRSPWILGMIVRPDWQGKGIGRLLLSHLEAWAISRGYNQLWVATGGPAVTFYQKCGWELVETVKRVEGGPAVVLTNIFEARTLQPKRPGWVSLRLPAGPLFVYASSKSGGCAEI